MGRPSLRVDFGMKSDIILFVHMFVITFASSTTITVNR